MKAVVYHADSKVASERFKFPPGTYAKLMVGLKYNLLAFDIRIVHLTTVGHSALSDEYYRYAGDPEDTVYNRDDFFAKFLKMAPDDTYWRCEPDHRMRLPIPELNSDLAVLRRQNNVPMSPSWCLARPSAAPFFEEVLNYYPPEKHGWDGDSTAWTKMFELIGRPNRGIVKYNGMTIEMRDWNHYSLIDSPITTQHKATNKLALIEGVA